MVLFDVIRSCEELLKRINSERVNKIKNLPCGEMSTAVVNDDYTDVDDDIHLPARRINVLVTADYYDDNSRNYLMETNNNTERDWTKNTNVYGFYDLIMESNLLNYSCGIGDKPKVKSYYINNNNVMSVIKDENCYVKIRLIFDDGG